MALPSCLKFFCPSTKLPPQTWGMFFCHLSVASIAVATGFYLSFAIHKVDAAEQLALWVAVALISVLFLSESLKHLEHEALSSRLQESREFFSKLRGFSFKRIGFSQESVEKNVRRVSVSIAHFQGLTLFFLMFAFLLHRLAVKFSSEVTIAASLSIGAFLPWLAAGQ